MNHSRRTLALFILGAEGVARSYGAGMDCTPLDPREKVSTDREVKIHGTLDTVYKIAKAGGSIEGHAKQEIQNLQQGATGPEQDPIKLRYLYLVCEMFADAKDLSTERKFQLLNQMLTIKDEPIPVTPVKPPAGHSDKTADVGSTGLDGEYSYRRTQVTTDSGGCNIRDDSLWRVYQKDRDLLLYRRLFHHFEDSPSCRQEEYFICASVLRIIPTSDSFDLQSGLSFDTVGSSENRADRATGLSTVYYLDNGALVNSTEAIARCAKKVPTSGFKGKLARKSPLQLLLSGPAIGSGVVLTRDEQPQPSSSESLQLPK